MRLFATTCLGALAILALAAAGDGDIRQPTARNTEERTFVLGQMRLFVETLHLVTEKLAAGDTAGAAEAASRRGAKQSALIWKPANLHARETDGWKQMMGFTRSGFDEVAAAASAGAPLPQILARLSETEKGCVDCHRLYRLADAPD